MEGVRDNPRCDICGEEVHPMDRHVRLPTHTLYSGAIGPGVLMCAKCAQEKLGVNPEAFSVG